MLNLQKHEQNRSDFKVEKCFFFPVRSLCMAFVGFGYQNALIASLFWVDFRLEMMATSWIMVVARV